MFKSIVLVLALVSVNAQASIAVEEAGSKAIFSVDGNPADPVQAMAAAQAGKTDIKKCTPIKDAVTSDGKPAYRCKTVMLVVNPKTGTTKWKNL